MSGNQRFIQEANRRVRQNKTGPPKLPRSTQTFTRNTRRDKKLGPSSLRNTRIFPRREFFFIPRRDGRQAGPRAITLRAACHSACPPWRAARDDNARRKSD